MYDLQWVGTYWGVVVHYAAAKWTVVRFITVQCSAMVDRVFLCYTVEWSRVLHTTVVCSGRVEE